MEPELASGSSPPIQTKPPRDFFKCQFCRDKKRKCEEYDYEKGERCRSCIAGNKKCGPRIGAHEAQPNRAAPAIASTPSTTSSFPSSGSFPSSSFSTNGRTSSIPYTPSPAVGTPSCATPGPSSHRARWSFLHEVNEARAPSAKDLVRSKLSEFGIHGYLFENLDYNLNAAIRAQPNLGLRPHDEVQNMINSILDLVRAKCTSLCDQILAALQQVTSRTDRELFLRSFNDKATYLLALAPSSTGDSDRVQNREQGTGSSQNNQQDDFQDIKAMHYFAVSQLATALEESGDFSESLRQKRRLADLGQSYGIPDQERVSPPSLEAFERLSSGLNDAFKSLGVPARFARLLPKMDNIFPPTHLAVQHQYNETAFNLLEAGADPQACDILKRQAIHIAAETGNLTMLRLALGRHEAAKSARDIFEQTALCIAAYMGDLDVFKHLLTAGDDLSVRDIARRSVLAIASSAGNLSIVQYLLDQGWRPNDAEPLQPLGVPSALHTAAHGGHSKCAALLLDKGASALFQCQGMTPAQAADSQGHHELADHLRSAEREQESRLANQFHLAEQALMSNFVDDAAFLSQISSTSTSPYTLPPAMTPSLSVTMGTPLPTSAPGLDLLSDIQHDVIRSMSRAGSMAMPSPRTSDTPPASTPAFSKKRSYPTASSHRSSPCPSDISSQHSSGPSKRRQTSDL